MKVGDVISEIRFSVASTHDLTDRSTSSLFTTNQIVRQLKFALDEYAQYTKALEATTDISMQANVSYITEPSDILRSEGYRFAWITVSQYRQPLNISNMNHLQTQFALLARTGTPKWLLPWENKLYIYPKPDKDYESKLYYYKTHFVIPVKSDDTIDANMLDRDMEVSDVHIHSIINRTIHLLLKKVDPEKSLSYQDDWQNWLPKAKINIQQGRSDIDKSGTIRDEYDWEKEVAACEL